jgi:histidinol-phosphatase (PHP family)
MESGLFSFIAHPDAFGIGYKKWDENAVSCSADILSAASELGILLEINGYGLRKSKIDTPDGKRYKYPLNPFWEMAANFDITAVCNSDAHRPEDVAASITDARAIAEKYNVETTDMIPFINRG